MMWNKQSEINGMKTCWTDGTATKISITPFPNVLSRTIRSNSQRHFLKR